MSKLCLALLGRWGCTQSARPEGNLALSSVFVPQGPAVGLCTGAWVLSGPQGSPGRRGPSWSATEELLAATAH